MYLSVSVFYLVFHAKSSNTNNNRNGSIRYHIKALSVVFRTTLKNFEIIFFNVEKNRFKVFDFGSYFQLIRSACRLEIAHLS